MKWGQSRETYAYGLRHEVLHPKGEATSNGVASSFRRHSLTPPLAFAATRPIFQQTPFAYQPRAIRTLTVRAWAV